jgi:hypothetical protein
LINSYIANVSSEIDSLVGMNVKWQATYKTAVLAGYSWTYRELPGQGNAPPGSERIDRLNYASVKVEYEPFWWLSIKPYANLQTRSSNYAGANFNATVYGVYFAFQWSDQPPKAGGAIHFPGQP